MEVGTPMKLNKEFIHGLKDYPKVHDLFVVMLWKMKEVGHPLSIDIVQPILPAMIDFATLESCKKALEGL